MIDPALAALPPEEQEAVRRVLYATKIGKAAEQLAREMFEFYRETRMIDNMKTRYGYKQIVCRHLQCSTDEVELIVRTIHPGWFEIELKRPVIFKIGYAH